MVLLQPNNVYDDNCSAASNAENLRPVCHAVVYGMSPNSHHSRWPLVVDLLREGKLWEAKHRMTQYGS